MRCGVIVALAFFFTGMIDPVLAQQQIFKTYTVNDGLVANSIRRMFQDSKGFLWIATWEGLSKYDGHTFTNYSTANGLSHNLVNDFFESKDGTLYVALNNGSIDIISGNTIIHKDKAPEAVINRFLYSSQQQIIVSTDRKGLQEFREGKLSPPAHKFASNTYLELMWLNDSLFMAQGDSSLEIFNSKYELQWEWRDPLARYTGCGVYQDSKKRIWVGTVGGLRLLNDLPRKSGPLTFAMLPTAFNIPALQKRKITDIAEDASGTMWFATTGGLVKINPDGSNQLITVKDGLASNIVTSIFQDNEKNIWFGSEGGLSKLVTRSDIRLYPIENGIWLNDNVYLLYPFKKDHLLVSTKNGVEVFNKITGKFAPVTNSKPELFYSVAPNTNPPLLTGLDKMATFDTLTLKYSKPFSFPLNGIFRVVGDKQGNFFICNLEYLFFISGKTYQKILDYRITSLLVDKEGTLWAGTWENGLFRIRYNTADHKWTAIATDHFLPAENIRSLLEDSKGNIWAGTRYKGVYLLKRKANDSFVISNFDQSRGLTSNFVKEIIEDANGNFWIAFYQGLDKLIPRDSSYRIFNFSRINNYFAKIIGLIKDDDHSLWLATGEGLVHITDGELDKQSPLPVYITKVSSPDSVYPLDTKKLHLKHRQNQVQFEFTSPGFINEKQLVYSYRLTGSSNTDWTAASNQHIVSYASLQPGSYLFEVRTQGWNGEWGQPATFEFTITPPLWQTWWFIALCSLLAGLIVYGLIRRRIKTIHREAQMKQTLAETKMMALRAQMNPHFIFNCLNSIDNLIQMDQKEKATNYLAKFAQLIRAILENSKNNTIPCWKDLVALKLYMEMEELRWDNKINCQINIAEEIQNGDYKVPPMILQPFVENAIHHGLLNKVGADKKLVIEVGIEGSTIKYIVTDNGVGRLKSGEYKKLNRSSPVSSGIQITRDRIDLFNHDANGAFKITDLYNELNEPEGTRVEVWLTTQPYTT